MDDTSEPTPQKPRYRVAKNYLYRIPVRLTATEREAIFREAREAGTSISRYLARTITDRRYPPTLRDREELFRTRFLLEKASVNLNQIAYRLNTAAKGAPVVPPTLIEIRQIARMVKVLAMEVKRRMK